MSVLSRFPLVAVDIGNSRIKLGLFERPPGDRFAEPDQAAAFNLDWQDGQLDDWLSSRAAGRTWLISSVQRAGTIRLANWLEQRGVQDARPLSVADLPLQVDVARPESVGMDRLVSAVAVNHLREPGRAGIIIDSGSANTVDLVSARGVYLGGAILPGLDMSARALHQFTDLLPLLPMAELADQPDPLGKTTVSAMRSGLYWGTIGALNEMVRRLSAGQPEPEVFLTGGAAAAVAPLVCAANGAQARLVPHLTLGGIALAACR